MNAPLIIALVLAFLAAVLHVYIFVMESVTWTSEKTRRTFGLSLEQARATKEMAFNQGFYNLFLAIAVFVGIVFTLFGEAAVGTTLVIVGVASMFAAATVLFASSSDKRRAAITQGTLPLLSLVAYAFTL